VLSCVIVVENLPVPFDRRVWQEAQALRDTGWQVSVICPKTKKHPLAFEFIDGISVYRHALPLEARGKFGFVVEYLSALFHECRLLAKIASGPGFDVIQVCNPPDVLFLNALPYKLFGKRLVFDLHDLCPELMEAKFGKRRLLHSLLLAAEKMTIKAADLVVCANDVYRDTAIRRGGKRPEDVVTVYSVPRRGVVRRIEPGDTLRRGARIVIGYIGVIADQDGVDHFIRMMDCLVNGLGRKDLRAIVVGDGPARTSICDLADQLGLSDAVTFTGYLSGDELMAALSAFDIGIIPDPVNPYNDKISMNKVFEYSALGVPSVAYPLSETRRLLGSTAHYADDATPQGLARACLTLIDDEAARLACGRDANALADERFSWAREREKYVAAYARLSRAYAVAPALAKS
jgi:glycosyltransferase involved in cell wall biosynthesis